MSVGVSVTVGVTVGVTMTTMFMHVTPMSVHVTIVGVMLVIVMEAYKNEQLLGVQSFVGSSYFIPFSRDL